MTHPFAIHCIACTICNYLKRKSKYLKRILVNEKLLFDKIRGSFLGNSTLFSHVLFIIT